MNPARSSSLSGSETAPPFSGPGPTTPPVPTPPAGKEGGRPCVSGYEVLEELGRGGMGVVYRAKQLRAGRLVALKMIRVGESPGAEELARFRTEVEAVARLQHPHVVQIFDVGEHQGLPYFSMELCPGGSLKDRLLAGSRLERSPTWWRSWRRGSRPPTPRE